MPRSNPNDWKKYQRQGRSTSLTGGMTFGSDENGLGTANFLSENFDIGGGQQLTPQRELALTNEAIRGGGVMKSPDTSVTPSDLSFITASPDGGNYMTPRETEIPPYLRRDPTPEIQPSALVQPQAAPGGGRTSSVADAFPIRANYQKREAQAKLLEERAAKALSSGWAKVFPQHVNQSAMQDYQLAQSIRGLDAQDYQKDVNEFYIKNPDRFDEWQKRAVITQGKPVRYQPSVATDRGSGDLVLSSDAGTMKRVQGVSETQLVSNEQIAVRQKEQAELRAAAEAEEHKRRLEIGSQQHGQRMEEIGERNKGTAPKGFSGGAAKPASPSQLNAALKQGKPGTPKYEAAMQQMGLTKHDDGSWWTTGSAQASTGAGSASSSPASAPTSKFAITKRK